jgi:hypothetical protein
MTSRTGAQHEHLGELVPVCTVTLNPSAGPIFFGHHTLLWRDPQVEITAKVLKGSGKRMLAGLPSS